VFSDDACGSHVEPWSREIDPLSSWRTTHVRVSSRTTSKTEAATDRARAFLQVPVDRHCIIIRLKRCRVWGRAVQSCRAQSVCLLNSACAWLRFSGCWSWPILETGSCEFRVDGFRRPWREVVSFHFSTTPFDSHACRSPHRRLSSTTGLNLPMRPALRLPPRTYSPNHERENQQQQAGVGGRDRPGQEADHRRHPLRSTRRARPHPKGSRRVGNAFPGIVTRGMASGDNTPLPTTRKRHSRPQRVGQTYMCRWKRVHGHRGLLGCKSIFPHESTVIAVQEESGIAKSVACAIISLGPSFSVGFVDGCLRHAFCSLFVQSARFVNLASNQSCDARPDTFKCSQYRAEQLFKCICVECSNYAASGCDWPLKSAIWNRCHLVWQILGPTFVDQAGGERGS